MKNCKTCQKEFIVTIDRTTFCSHICQAKWAITIASLNRSGPPKTGEFFVCIVCKKEYYVQMYRIKKGISKYCSRSCLAKDHLSKFSEFYGFKKLNKPHHKYKVITINGKRYREHRYIMEQYLGRKLEPWEHIHHIMIIPLTIE
jgi:hypothetical protein